MEKNETMTAEPSSSRRHGTRRRSRSSRPEQEHTRPEAAFYKRYWVEILATVFMLLGIFLLVERFRIRSVLYGGFVWLTDQIGSLGGSFLSWAKTIESSDVIGVLLVLGAAVLVCGRIRSRMINSASIFGGKCPNCGHGMRRISGRIGDRLLALLLFVRIKRYSCRKCPSRASVWEGKRAIGGWQ